LVVEGYSEKQIAAKLGISEHSVHATMKGVRLKSGVHSASEIARRVRCREPLPGMALGIECQRGRRWSRR
jgi:DNA-binding CsgD family transcriptional regulator